MLTPEAEDTWPSELDVQSVAPVATAQKQAKVAEGPQDLEKALEK